MKDLDKQGKSVLDSLLKGGVSALALSVVAAGAMPAYAQDDDTAVEDSDDDTIVVQGIRRSIQNAQEIKREADNFVDAVSAEDIGALPDRSVLEALQRVPGISISRFAAGNDPDHFSVEGSGVVVRGLNFVRSEINGRDTFSANNGRALSFSDVPSELLQSVRVSKNNSADMIEGGLAGTVNLVTRKPFDSAGRTIAGSLEYSYSDFREEGAPTISGLWSDRWDTEIGEFGLLANGVFSELKTRSDGIQASNFFCRTDIGGGNAPCANGPGVYFPRGAAFRSQDNDRERIGLAAAAQWESTDGNWEAVFQYLRSESSISWTETGSEIATDVVRDQGDSRPVLGTNFEFNDDSLFTRGTITAPTGWQDDGNYNWRVSDCNSGQAGCNARTPYWGLQTNNLKRDVEQTYITADHGFNLKWTPTDRMRFNFDVQYVDSTVENLDVSLWTSSFVNADLDFTPGELPRVTFLPPSVDGNYNQGVNDCTTGGPGTGEYPGPQQAGGSTGDPAGFGCSFYANDEFLSAPQYFWRAAMDHAEDSEGNEWAYQADGEFDLSDDGWLRSIKVGARYSERDQTTRWSGYNWGVTSEIWGSGGPVWIDELVDAVPDNNGYGGTNGVPSTDYMYQEYFDNFFRGETTLPTAGYGIWTYAGNTAKNYEDFTTFAQAVASEWRCERETPDDVTDNDPTTCHDAIGAQQNWVPLAARDNVIPGTMFLPNEINDTLEEVMSFYVMGKFGHEWDDGTSLSGNIGVRYVNTKNTALGSIGFPQLADLPSDGDCTFDGTDALADFLTSNPGATQQEQDDFLADAEAQFLQGINQNSPFCNESDGSKASARAFSNGAAIPDSAKADYTNILPSFNMKYDLGNGMLFRFGYSTSISRPDLGLTRNFVTIAPRNEDTNGDGNNEFLGFQVGNSGNPYLEPIKSTQYDASFEYYFADTGSVTVSLFSKVLEDVHTNGFTDREFTNNGETYNVLVRTAANASKKGKIRGMELAYQQFYDMLPAPWDGFGVQANYTYIDSDGVPQENLSPENPNGSSGTNPNVDTSLLPLVGLSEHNVNFATIYEKGPLSARLAYNWRSEYLLTVRDVIVPFAPIYNEDTGQLDGSIFYSINDNVKVGMQGVNLLDEITETSQVLDDTLIRAGRSWFINDRRFTFIVRGTF